jgi:uracil-DNA glycosylase
LCAPVALRPIVQPTSYLQRSARANSARHFCRKGRAPVLQVHSPARILISGQAPGRKIHQTGIPFDDPSGDRLRDWMGIDKSTFYDATRIAILPIGLCYPSTGKSGDLPPRSGCAAVWRAKLIARMPDVQLMRVIGQYTQAWHLSDAAKEGRMYHTFARYAPPQRRELRIGLSSHLVKQW